MRRPMQDRPIAVISGPTYGYNAAPKRSSQSSPLGLAAAGSAAITDAPLTLAAMMPHDFVRLLTVDDAAFYGAVANPSLQRKMEQFLSSPLASIPFLEKGERPDITCQGNICQITGRFADNTSIYNRNISMTGIRSVLSSDSLQSVNMTPSGKYYWSDDRGSYFRAFIRQSEGRR
ncbi:hypothetical protein ACU5AX_16310 [Sphingomonas sp. XXL09]|uniref:hypothetical protein n=1 Tax=Sphingomonas sp. XXL09 TaxID=3457787 RepID=UPI00406BC563